MEYLRLYSDLYKYRHLYLLEWSLSVLFVGLTEYFQLNRLFMLMIPIYWYQKKYYYLHMTDTLNTTPKKISKDFEYPKGWYKVSDSCDISKGMIKSSTLLW